MATAANLDAEKRALDEPVHTIDDGDAITTTQPTSATGSVVALDDNYHVYKQSGHLEISPSDAKHVLRKIDARIVPILFFLYMLQYLDKNAINFASAYGLNAGTGMTANDYNWLSSIFYFGYLISQFPSSYLLQRLPVAKFISIATIVWGIILMTTPACRSFGGIATNRFFLGVTEATVNPGFVLMMSMWYTAAEQPLRLESYYCTNGVATMFGGLIGYAVGHITTGLPKWMYVFLIFGSISLATGIIALIFLPDLPATAKFLSSANGPSRSGAWHGTSKG
jgi:sugar phosphate permease